MFNPAERPSERDTQSPVIIKDFPGVFVRPPFEFSPANPSQDEPEPLICRPRKLRRGLSRTPSGEVILQAIYGRSSSDANGCNIESNAGDSSISYQDTAEEAVRRDQENGQDIMSNSQTDIRVAPGEVTVNSPDLSRWILSSDNPEDVSLDQLANFGDPQNSIQKNPEPGAPALDTMAKRGDLSADGSSGDSS